MRHPRTGVPARAGAVAGLACLAALAAAVPANADINVSRSAGGTKVLVIGSTMAASASLSSTSMTLRLAHPVKASAVKVAGGCRFTAATRRVSCRLHSTKPAVITWSAIATSSSSLTVLAPRFRGHLRFLGGAGRDRLDVRNPQSPMNEITFSGGGGRDTLRLDPLRASAFRTNVDGGPDNDTLLGSVGQVHGGFWHGISGADDIDGGAGNDRIDARNGVATIIGGTGTDTISTNGGAGVRIETIDGEIDTVDCRGDLATNWFADAGDRGTGCSVPLPELP